MKIIKYTLTSDGKIPDYVIDGGQLSVANNKPWPQNLDHIGLATDDATEPVFATEDELIQYAKDNNITSIDPFTKEVISIETVVTSLLTKWSGINNG